MDELLTETAARAADYLRSVGDRPVAPTAEALSRWAQLNGDIPNGSTDPLDVIRILDEFGSPATTASAGGRYFGLVIGGSLPAALAASWLATAWDQNAGVKAASPMAADLEEIALCWLLDILRLPEGSGGAFVTGATMASFTALAAARQALLARMGWNAQESGLFYAPPLTVVVGEEAHVSVLKALGLLGLGSQRVVRVPVDAQGRMRVDALPPLDQRTIVCIQAGNVNTGSFDPARAICAVAREAGAWVHVDGAFGLWAAASPSKAYLGEGVEDADSWATDGHKWLNVPYDSGIAFVRESRHLRAAMAANAAYLQPSEGREPYHYTPEMSRRARAVEIWAALRSLGREGVADLVDRTCRHASRMASRLEAAGFEILNDVVLNQVLVSFGDDELSRRTIAAVQAEGTCWCGGTVWQGRTAMRISLSSWATSDADVELSLAAIMEAARTSRASVNADAVALYHHDGPGTDDTRP